MAATDQTTKRSISCATDEAVGSVSDVLNATLELVGDLAKKTAEATVPCNGKLDEAKPGTTPVSATVHYGVEALNNIFSIISNAARDTIRDTMPVAEPTTTTAVADPVAPVPEPVVPVTEPVDRGV